MSRRRVIFSLLLSVDAVVHPPPPNTTPQGTLYDFIRNKKNHVTWEIMLHSAVDISSGMNYLHSRGFLQRDLKSMNLLVNRRL